MNDQVEAALARAHETAERGAFVGLPSISVPAGLTASGLPVGLSFDGLSGTDSVLLALAAAFERCRQQVDRSL
jgi:indoleacetamide hydrolase